MTIEASLTRIAVALEALAAARPAAAEDAPARAPARAAEPAPSDAGAEPAKPRGRGRPKKTPPPPAEEGLMGHPVAAPVAPAEPAPPASAPPAAPVVAQPVAGAVGLTLDTLKQRVSELTQDNPQVFDMIRGVLTSMGVSRVSELPAGEYDVFLDRVEALR